MRIQGCVNEEKYLNGQIQKEIPKEMSGGLNLPQMLSRGDSDCSGFSSLKCVSIIKLIQVESLNAGWHEVRFFLEKSKRKYVELGCYSPDRHVIHYSPDRHGSPPNSPLQNQAGPGLIWKDNDNDCKKCYPDNPFTIHFDPIRFIQIMEIPNSSPLPYHNHLPSSKPDGARKVWSPDTPVVAPAASSCFASTW